MLNDARGFSRIVVTCGKTDLRKGIDGLAAVVEGRLRLNPGEKNVLFLFCGTRPDRIKGLVTEINFPSNSTNSDFALKKQVKKLHEKIAKKQANKIYLELYVLRYFLLSHIWHEYYQKTPSICTSG